MPVRLVSLATFLGLILIFSSCPTILEAGAYDQLLQMSGGSAPSVPEPSAPSYTPSNSYYPEQHNRPEDQEYRRELRAKKAQRQREQRQKRRQQQRRKKRNSSRRDSSAGENRVSVTPGSKLKPGEEKATSYQWPQGLPGKRYTRSSATKSSSTLKSPHKNVPSGQEAKVLAETNLSIKILRKKVNLSSQEKQLLAELEKFSRDLWLKTVSQTKIGEKDRLKAQVPLPVSDFDPSKPLPIWSTDATEASIKSKTAQATNANYHVFVDALSKFHTDKSQQLVELIGSEHAETILPGHGEAIFGNLLSLGKVSIKLAGKNYAKAGAEIIDMAISRIGLPQAQLAVEGGRIYSDVAFRSLDSFMKNSMHAVGGKFDGKAFWKNLKEEMNGPQQAFFEWIGGHEYEK